MHVVINAAFLDQPYVGSGQYVRLLARALIGLGTDDVYTLLVPEAARTSAPARGIQGQLLDQGSVRRAKDQSGGALNLTPRPPSRCGKGEHDSEAAALQHLPSPCRGGAGGEVHSPASAGSRSKVPLRVRKVAVPPLPRHLGKAWFEFVLVPLWARRLDAAVVHYPYLCGPLIPAPPTVVTVHDVIPLALREYGPVGPAALYARVAARAAARATRLLADSAHTAADLSRIVGAAGERVRVVPLAPDPRCRAVTARAALEGVRARYDLPPRFVLYLGGLDRRKNLSVVLAALAKLGDADGPPLVVAGRHAPRPPLFPDYAAEARARGVADRVRFVGLVPEEDKPALFSAARAFVFPSRYEGFGLPPLEALACGLPVVCAASTSLPEVVGDAGLLVGPDDVSGWAHAVQRVWSDDALVAELRARGLARAAQFSWPAVARAVRATYLEAADC